MEVKGGDVVVDLGGCGRRGGWQWAILVQVANCGAMCNMPKMQVHVV